MLTREQQYDLLKRRKKMARKKKSLITNPQTGCRIRPTVYSDKLISRLNNCKFESALQYMWGQPREVQTCIRALARLYGNTGWVMGDQGVLLGMAVELLVGTE